MLLSYLVCVRHLTTSRSSQSWLKATCVGWSWKSLQTKIKTKKLATVLNLSLTFIKIKKKSAECQFNIWGSAEVWTKWSETKKSCKNCIFFCTRFVHAYLVLLVPRKSYHQHYYLDRRCHSVFEMQKRKVQPSSSQNTLEITLSWQGSFKERQTSLNLLSSYCWLSSVISFSLSPQMQ